MQNEFSKERRLKLKQLKQTAVKASRSKMDLISRREARYLNMDASPTI